MSKRLQVIVDEEEYAHIQRAAERQRMTVSEWVRRMLRRARATEPSVDAGRKLESVRAAMRYEYPTADIAQMLREIEAGYEAGPDG